MTDRSSSSISTTDAIEAMRARGIDNAESLVSSTSPERIVASCKVWDSKKNVTAGLLAKMVRDGGSDPEPAPKASPRDRFAHLVQHYSEGSVAESHKRLQRRSDYDEDCDGLLIVVEEPAFPSLVVRCDGCGFEAAYPFKALASGILHDPPPVGPRPVPDPQPMVPREQWRRPADRPATRDLYPAQPERSFRWGR
jgi:hypothetical protein